MKFTEDSVPDQTGRTVLVTGANSGLGLEATRILAGRGARVLVACRSPEKGERAVAPLRAAFPSARMDLVALDLADLASVKSIGERLPLDVDGIDVLMNNAGVMAIPRQLTKDGFEMQLGTNHLGHFALTATLLPRMKPNFRVVTLSSGVHWNGKMHFDDLMGAQRYEKWDAYCQSKLANLLFHFALARRLGDRAKVVAAHPGYSATNLQHVSADAEPGLMGRLMTSVGNRVIAQSAAMGALPQVYAATSPEAQTGDYIGPDGFLFEAWGHPKKVGCSARARSVEDQERLWTLSVGLTGVDLPA
jgi:NAD(P)-dependent dehydrogenase (short-subunit alcohol dehydrogenase family)